MKCLLATVFLTLCAGTANAAIIYDVNRTIAEGTVTGFIETDGTEGILDTDNITRWSLTLTALNLNGGSPYLIEGSISGSGSGVRVLNGTAVSATSTQLRYDFNKPGSLLFRGALNSSSPTYFWCLETSFCSDADDSSEHLGRYLTVGTEALQWEHRSGEIVFANATVIPVPAAVWLFGSGLIGLAGFARRKS